MYESLITDQVNTMALGFNFLLAIVGYYMAENKNRNGVVWGILTFIFSFLTLIVLAFYPKLEKQEKKEGEK